MKMCGRMNDAKQWKDEDRLGGKLDEEDDRDNGEEGGE